MPKLKVTQLEADPKNPNVCSPTIQAKMKRNMKRTGCYDYPIVRPHPSKPDTFIIIDGHARVQIFKELGWEEVFCQVWKVSEKDARLAMATLNRLRGTDVPYKRAELIEELTELISPTELAELIPETETQIQDLLSLLAQDTAAMEKALKAEMEREEKALPLPLTFMLTAEEHEIWEKAHDAFANGMTDRSKVLIVICNKAMEGNHENDPKEKE
jgi:ParB-like chromosome segregation protein Spo0J